MAVRLLLEQVAGRRPKSKSLLDRLPEVERDLEIAGSLGKSLDEFEALPESVQELHIAKHERDEERCLKCGGPRSKCSDPEHPWYPQRTVCLADMEAAAANRRYDELHKDEPFHDGTFSSWAPSPRDHKGELTHPYHYRDGVSIRATPVDLNPHDHFLGGAKACEECNPRGGGDGDEA